MIEGGMMIFLPHSQTSFKARHIATSVSLHGAITSPMTLILVVLAFELDPTLINVHVLVVLVSGPVQTLVVGFITLVTFVVGALKLIKRLVWRC